MEIALLIITTLLIILFYIRKKGKNTIQDKNKSKNLKELVKKTFPKYKVIEKNQMIMICEINHKNEPDELVFIRINENSQKSIKQSRRMIIAEYPYNPSAKEMKKDFGRYLN